MLNIIILLSVYAKSGQKRHTLDTTLSLFGPPLDENGKSPRYNFDGDYACTTHCSSGYSYTQLGHLINNSTSTLSSKSQTNENFRIEFKLQLEPLKRKGEQILIWFSESPMTNYSDNFNGALTVLKISSNELSLSAFADKDVSINRLKKSLLPEKLFNVQFDLRLEKVDDKFRVFVKSTEDYEKKFEFDCGLKRGYLGISADMQNGFSRVKLFGIRYFVTTDMEIELRKGSGKLVWLLFVLFAAALSWYLYKNYMRYK